MAIKHTFNADQNLALINRFKEVRDTIHDERESRVEQKRTKKDILTYRTGQAARLKK